MAGLDPAIHAFAAVQDVDARNKSGHDALENPDLIGALMSQISRDA
jgi:hypothetical protein